MNNAILIIVLLSTAVYSLNIVDFNNDGNIGHDVDKDIIKDNITQFIENKSFFIQTTYDSQGTKYEFARYVDSNPPYVPVTSGGLMDDLANEKNTLIVDILLQILLHL